MSHPGPNGDLGGYLPTVGPRTESATSSKAGTTAVLQRTFCSGPAPPFAGHRRANERAPCCSIESWLPGWMPGARQRLGLGIRSRPFAA